MCEKSQEVQAMLCFMLAAFALILAVTLSCCRLSSRISRWEETHSSKPEEEIK